MLVPEEVLADVIGRLLAAGAGFAEVYAQRSDFTHLAREGRMTGSANRGHAEGAGLRVFCGGGQGFTSVSTLDPDALLREAEALAGNLAGGGARFRGFAGAAEGRLLPPAERPEEVPQEAKTDLLLSAEAAALSFDPRIRAYAGIYRDATGEVLVANSDGVLATDLRQSLTLYQQAAAGSGDGLLSGAQVLVAEQASDLLVTGAHEEDAREAARAALARLEFKSVPSGACPVVFAPGAAGPLLHEALGHAFEGDYVADGTSPLAGRLGERVAPPGVTLGDGASDTPRRCCAECDDEGTPPVRAVLVEDGILRGFLPDRATAPALGLALTGHARRESFRFPPLPRMRALFLAPGAEAPEEMLRPVEFGLYVLKTSGGPVEIPSGGFAVRITRGRMVRQGRLAEPVCGGILVGTGPDLLAAIDAVGRDTGSSAGTCLKRGQRVPVSETVPGVRVSRLDVKGE